MSGLIGGGTQRCQNFSGVTGEPSDRSTPGPGKDAPLPCCSGHGNPNNTYGRGRKEGVEKV
jgi:hypothetical protein